MVHIRFTLEFLDLLQLDFHLWSAGQSLVGVPLLSVLSRDISFELQRQKMMAALKENAPVCFLPFFKDSLIDRREYDILSTLDQGGLVGGRVCVCVCVPVLVLAKVRIYALV